MTLKRTIAAITLGLALPAAAATTAELTTKAPLPPCATSAPPAAPNAEPTCLTVALGANINPLAKGTDDDRSEDANDDGSDHDSDTQSDND
jgi:hypothetical protein